MTVQTRPFRPIDKAVSIAGILSVSVGIVLLPTYFTYRELVYSQYGKTVDATVTHRAGGWQSGGRNAPRRPVLNIEYSFQDNAGSWQSGNAALPSGSDVQKGQSIKVEYIPGAKGMSRVMGNKRNLMGIWLPCGFVAIFGLMAAWLVWRMPTTSPAPEKQNPVKRDGPPVVWSQADRRNWLIACVVGAIIIAVSLFIDRGVVGVLITLIVLFGLFVLFAADRFTQEVRQRTRDLWRLAKK